MNDFVREKPLTAMAISAAAGFILGGGAGTRVRRAALAFVGRLTVRGAVGNLLVGMLTGSNERGSKEFEDRG